VNLRNFVGELKRRNVYKLAVAFVSCGKASPLFELARVLVRLDHVASFIVNANHCIVRPAIKLCVTDYVWIASPATRLHGISRNILRNLFRLVGSPASDWPITTL
jgi:hypothetical protein